MTKILISVLLVLAAAWLFFGYEGWKNSIQNGHQLVLPIVAIAALVDSINPCALSVLFLTIGFLFSLGKSRSYIMKIGLVYIFGIFLVYILIGLGILRALDFFGVPHLMTRLGAAILILYGIINLLNEFFPSFPIKLRMPKSSHVKIAQLMERATIPAAFGLGVLVGLFEFPCTGGPYLMILGLLHDKSTFGNGLAYLLFYNLIFVLPLVVLLLVASDAKLLEKARNWKSGNSNFMRFSGGIFAIILGIIIYLL